jgi:diguanylate cyclase (GGDEF)-like protein
LSEQVNEKKRTFATKKIGRTMKDIFRKREIWYFLIASCMYAIAGFSALKSLSLQSGNARVINYASLVRASTQKLVKEELHGEPNDQLIANINTVVDGLIYGSKNHELIALQDSVFQLSMRQIYLKWEHLKIMIMAVRAGAKSDDLYLQSELFFELVNDAVFRAEKYTESELRESRSMLIGINAFFIAIALGGLAYLVVQTFRSQRLNHLASIAYVDMLTGLNNRTKFTDVCTSINRLHQPQPLAAVMFDMNYLEIANAHYGHELGDTLIKELATRIKNSAGNGHVFRVGGDEFVVIFEDSSQEKIKAFLDSVQNSVDEYNQTCDNDICSIHYAFGYEINILNEPNKTVENLVKEADRKMYENKRLMKPLETNGL